MSLPGLFFPVTQSGVQCVKAAGSDGNASTGPGPEDRNERAVTRSSAQVAFRSKISSEPESS